MSDNIKVVVKVRPLISRETDQKLSYQWLVKNNTLHQLDQSGSYTGNCFTFDKVYDCDTKTLEVYDDIAKPIVKAAISGFNGTIFAYGQTSSGKTYTMSGTEDSPGIIPLAVMDLFNTIKTIPDRVFLVRVSYIEIYNETVRDLLDMEKKNIKVFDTIKGVMVEVTKRPTASPDEVIAAMKEGEAIRQTGATNMNEESSRSHSIFQITIESRENTKDEDDVGCVNVSQLNLVDLAGSERSGQTGATGIRFKEGTHINKSLSVLALVIKQLSEDFHNPNKFINYRDSKLTRILQNSLGGNAKTSIICAITPATVDETISTLQFANRAKAIKNKPEVNVVATSGSEIHLMTKKLSMLQSQLESKKNIEQDNVNLQKQIATLQKLILNGFGQNRMEMMGSTRRKLHQPRRATISTLQPIEESPGPKAPKFCTPSLKYNPLAFATTEFVPVQTASKLTTLAEESRMVTPPPYTKSNANEVIEVPDSDDDDPDSGLCSPYHHCYSSKTPPCVLKKNAKEAVKNYKEIIELTTREKMFTPEKNELYEKLEQKMNIIAELEEQIEMLTKQSNDKDSELKIMKEKITETECQNNTIASAKSQLEAKCNEINTQLTDLEVSYESLKKKAKTREDELISLLEEKKLITKQECIDKIHVKTIQDKDLRFMDLSKDISLVNSDDESSITNEGSTAQIQDFVTELQTQLTDKNLLITDLEANIQEQKQTITYLDSASKDLQKTINDIKEKLSYIEQENEFLKSTVDNLTSTIESQKCTIETANKDITSYNNLIQELQIKLTTKENILNIKLDDGLLENIIASEQKFIENNENMKNIVHSFRVAFDTRNKEIEELTKKVQENASINNQIFVEEIEEFKNQINENNIVINRLMAVEKESLNKLTVLQEENDLYKKDNDLFKANMENMKKDLDKLTQELSEKEIEQQKNINHIESLSQKNMQFENNMSVLHEKISDFVNTFSITCQSIIKNVKLENVKISDLNQYKEQIPDSLECIIKTIEHIATEIIDRNQAAENKIIDVTDQFNTLLENEKLQLTTMQSDIENLKQQNENLIQKNNLLMQQNEELKTNFEKVQGEKEIKDNLVSAMDDSLHESKELIERLNQELQLKSDEIQSLKEKTVALTTEIVNISQNSEQLSMWKSEVESLKLAMEESRNSFTKIIKDKDDELAAIFHNIGNPDFDSQNPDILILIDKVTTLINENKHSNSEQASEEIRQCSFNEIRLLLNLIADHVTKLRIETDEYKNNMSKAEVQILELTKYKHELTRDYADIEKRNRDLLEELDYLKLLNKELLGSTEILEHLKSQLKAKTEEIEIMEDRAKSLKYQLAQFENVTKQQLQELQEENEKLKEGFPLPKFLFEHNHVKNNKELKSIPPQDNKFPPSLFTISYNKILESFKPASNCTSNTSSLSKVSVSTKDGEIQTGLCECEQLSTKLKDVKQKNRKLKDSLKDLKSINTSLLQEQEEIRNEVKLLLEPALELQKKIINHRTNLSTLTATTYAENKLLNSQLKVLKHYHTRYIHVCQRDLPAFKTQLSELMTILKGTTMHDKHNSSFKRYSLPDVLDNNSSISNYRNESTLDGDLLMLDTNITLATSADNTLVGHDQTCLDVTQINFDSEVACQTTTSDIGKVFEPCQLCSQIELVTKENKIIHEELENLKQENSRLKEEIKSNVNPPKPQLDAKSSPIKLIHTNMQGDLPTEKGECKLCVELIEEKKSNNELLTENSKILKMLEIIKKEKESLDKQVHNLNLEITKKEALVTKLGIFEKDYNVKIQEISKLHSDVKNKNKVIKELQEENDTLSSQLMDNITESDDLKTEVDELKQINVKLEQRCEKLELDAVAKISAPCTQCLAKDELINSLRAKQKTELRKLNRSLSDSESSSTHNKLSTLQQELHASKEDCIKFTEEVVNIKKHLDHSNFSNIQPMDLDESMGESNIFTFTKDFEAVVEPHINKFNLNNISEEASNDLYTLERMECLHFLIDKTGAEKENLDSNMKIIDVIKQLYNNLITKHNNEVENLMNKLKDLEESRSELHIQIENTTAEYSNIIKELENKDNNLKNVQNVIEEIRNSLKLINEEMTDIADKDQNLILVNMFKENVLTVMDTEFGLSSANIFNICVNNLLHSSQVNLNEIIEKYTQLQKRMEDVLLDFNTTTDCLNELKAQYSAQEKEYGMLKMQKEKVQEICNAVTLDIVKKEKELSKTISNGCKRLLDLNMMEPGEIDLTESADKNINVLFSTLIDKVVSQKVSDMDLEKENLILEAKKTYTLLKEKEKELDTLKLNLLEKDSILEVQISKHTDLNREYETQAQEVQSKLVIIQDLSNEITNLKETVREKETSIHTLENELKVKDKNISDFKEKLIDYVRENESLKSMNELILKEKDNYMVELEKSAETIKQNKLDLDKMTSDILILRESMKDNKSIIDSLKEEAKSLLQQNVQLKIDFENKSQECSRFEMNIKTYEKSAEIQSKIIIRLQKQKEEDTLAMSNKDKQIEELNEKCSALLKEYVDLQKSIDSSKAEVEELKKTNTALENRISELELELEGGHKHRFSIEAIAENTRRRRQSIHDSKRLFGNDFDDHKKAEDVFGARCKPDDLFMDVDDDAMGDFDHSDREDEGSRPGSTMATRLRRQSTYDLHRDALAKPNEQGETIFNAKMEDDGKRDGHSNKSSPNRLSKGRDSFHSAKYDHSDNEDEGSRPGSVMASRLRRQSTYDLNREIQHVSPKGTSQVKTDPGSNSEVSQLRERLAACQQELEELKEQYRELDDECETCAQYLRERDEQCDRLKREKAALEDQVQKLKSNSNINVSGTKTSFAHAAVNTDEDWTNLHSVVVDRMSYDAEVEKNKKLTKTVEDLRYKKQELKNMLAKMQKTFDKYAGSKDNREMELSKAELKSCKQELAELKQRYKELDEECDTCSKYLREREEQCVKLRESKTALENQVVDLTEKLKALQNRSLIEMKNRGQLVDVDEDWGNLHSKVVDRMSFDAEVEKNKKLMRTVDELHYQKQELRNALAKMQKAFESHPNGRDIAELDQLKSELKSSKQELTELKQKYKDLDAECETCAQYLREREEQCQRLKDAKETLEVKLAEYVEESSRVAVSARRKRQSLHDQKRQAARGTDAATDTTDDFLSYQVERDNSSSPNTMAREVKHLKMALDRVTKEKAALQQLASAQMTVPPMYVATGSAIVQNQQITDVMRENQKLKKINSKLISMCKKRGKTQDARENETENA